MPTPQPFRARYWRRLAAPETCICCEQPTNAFMLISKLPRHFHCDPMGLTMLDDFGNSYIHSGGCRVADLSVAREKPNRHDRKRAKKHAKL